MVSHNAGRGIFDQINRGPVLRRIKTGEMYIIGLLKDCLHFTRTGNKTVHETLFHNPPVSSQYRVRQMCTSFETG